MRTAHTPSRQGGARSSSVENAPCRLPSKPAAQPSVRKRARAAFAISRRCASEPRPKTRNTTSPQSRIDRRMLSCAAARQRRASARRAAEVLPRLLPLLRAADARRRAH
eukprot:316258-Pleurochrysis_carterae.AAC.2